MVGFDGECVYDGVVMVDPQVYRSKQTIVSQRSSLELASWSQKAGFSPQNVWPISYDIGASQVATQLRQFKNV